MRSWITGAVICFILGGCVALINDRIFRRIASKGHDKAMQAFALRELVDAAYLAAVFFLAPLTPWGSVPMLVAAVLGLTIFMFIFTYRNYARTVRRKEDRDDG